MKLHLLMLLLAVFLTNSVSAQVSFGISEKINTDWRFNLGDDITASSPEFNDHSWQEVNLPHDWSVKGQLSPTLASCTGYLPGGIGWYRKSIEIPATKQGQKVYFYFEGVYNRSEVYVNGHSLGKRPNGYISFMYDATPYVAFGKENVIAVRVDHSQSADSRWYTGSGIYRDVWLVYANPVHIAQWGVYAYPEVKSKNEAVVHVEVEMENGSKISANLTIQHELVAPNGKIIATATKHTQLPAKQINKTMVHLKVKNPLLWDLNHPVLYSLRTKVMQKGKMIDESVVKTGIRSFSFDANKGFALNGKSMKMKGVCLHHDAGVLGAASYKEVWRRRLLTLKEIGVNAIRTSHNPQASHLYELCDEQGFLVINEAFDEWEFPKRKWLEGWNVGIPGFQGSYDFFEEWGEKDLADMVRRDRNHVSIFAWSIGNEVDYPNDPYSHPILDGGGDTGFTQPIYGGYQNDKPDAMKLGDIAKKLVAVVKKYDVSRPVTAGLAGVTMSNETEYPEALDIAGYNYTESLYDSDHAKYPNRVIFGSENSHDLSAWKAVREKEHIFGQFLWTGIDYLGESGKWPSRGFYSGLVDLGGFVKPRGYFRKSLWSEIPMAYIGTYPTPEMDSKKNQDKLSMDAWPVWNYNDGQMIRVVCYTNAAKAKLLLNGQVVGDIKDYDEDTGIICWDIPYQEGKLEVEGFDKNQQVIARYEIQSSKRPHALVVDKIDPVITETGGLVHVVVQVVDQDGIPVMISEDEVTCHISGPGRLLGLEAGNNSDMGDYSDNKQRVYRGKMIAYVQSTGEKGEVKVQFTAPWLQSVETENVFK